jgi:hypothetical protein
VARHSIAEKTRLLPLWVAALAAKCCGPRVYS